MSSLLENNVYETCYYFNIGEAKALFGFWSSCSPAYFTLRLEPEVYERTEDVRYMYIQDNIRRHCIALSHWIMNEVDVCG